MTLKSKLAVMAALFVGLPEVMIYIARQALPGASSWQVALLVAGEYVLLGVLLWVLLPPRRPWRRGPG